MDWLGLETADNLIGRLVDDGMIYTPFSSLYADRTVRMVGYVCTSHVHIEYTPSTRFVGLTETNKKREPHGSLLTVGLGLPHELLGLWLGLIKRRRVLF